MPDHPTRPTDGAGLVPDSQLDLPGSVLLTGQVQSRWQRPGRYTDESSDHPGKMATSICRYLINCYTRPGDWVLDPMAGIGTTMVEAMRLGRNGVGVEFEAHWVRMAGDNIALAAQHGAPGTGEIYQGDSQLLPPLVPAHLHGRIALVITSPPYGASTHGHGRAPGADAGKMHKVNYRYSHNRDNLAYRPHDELADGFTRILTGCAAILRPGGVVAVTARPYHHQGDLVDIPSMVVAAGLNAGLRLHEELPALIAGVQDGRLISHVSVFQRQNAFGANLTDDPQWVPQHEDTIVFVRGGICVSSGEPRCCSGPAPCPHDDQSWGSPPPFGDGNATPGGVA
jgi:hypothetical protein